MADKGRNGGITGLVDITGSPAFHARIYSFTKTLGGSEKDRNGRGSGRWDKARFFRPGGSLVIRGQVRRDGYPLPNDWNGKSGTITLTFERSGTTATEIAVGVTVRNSEISYNEKTGDSWSIALVCRIVAMPVLSGFAGSQSVVGSQSFADLELYQGLSKRYDPKEINSSATQAFDVYGLADTDADELAKIQSIIANASAPMPDLQAKFGELSNREADGATITIIWDYNTTEDDIVFPSTTATFTPLTAGIRQSATVVGSADALIAAWSEYQALKDDVTFESVIGRQITPNKGVVITRARDNVIIVSFESSGGRYMCKTRLNNGDVEVFCNQISKAGSLYFYDIVPQELAIVRMDFSLTKRSADYPIYTGDDLVGTTNQSTFLGLAVNTVQFLGASGVVNYTEGGSYEITYRLRYYSNGVIDDSEIPIGNHMIPSSTYNFGANTKPRWIKASDLTYTASTAPGADYDALLS